MELALRIVLSVVLLWAAAAKLADMPRFASAVAGHGVPERFRRPVAWGVAVAEAALGILVLVGPTARAAALAAWALGLVFAASLVRLRLRGARRAPCGCFGSARERPIGLLAARALGLAALAGVVASGVAADVSAPSADALVVAALAVLAVVVAGLVVLVLALYRQVGVLEARLGPAAALELADEGPPLGATAPALAGLARSGPELVAFGSPGCRLCAEIAPAVRALARDGLSVHAIAEDQQPDVFRRYRVPGTPYVVYLEDGVVAAKGLVNTLEQIEELIATGRERARAAA
jgi:thiol-disulfide isomerase/thioredoxin